jgi:hypothetical protein
LNTSFDRRIIDGADTIEGGQGMKRSHRIAMVLSVAIIVAGAVPLIAGAAGPVGQKTSFRLFPNTTFEDCLRQNPNATPVARAVVTRGKRNDTLTLTLRHFKPGLNFDLFTIQKSNQDANGGAVAGFTNFGLAWYQSDIHVNRFGTSTVTIKTILLDQIFGFDPNASLTPTNTFHLGFWFDNVAAASGACSGQTPSATPFNGDHNAGPLAFITRPSATTLLGPLCTDSTTPGTCNP